MIRQKICQLLAPIVAADCSCWMPKASSMGISSRIMKGRVTNSVARTIPGTAKATLIFRAVSSGASKPLRPNSRSSM